MSAVPTYIYGETANDMLNTARVRLSDMVATPQGYPGGADPGQQFTEIGGGTQSVGTNPDGSLILRTQIIFNGAYRKFQKYLGNLGYRLLIADNLIISSLPANTNPDPAAQSWLSWNGFFNGTTFAATPALPQDFYAPLKVGERVTGTSSVFIPMRCALDGIEPRSVRQTLNRRWEWRTNGLYMPGATGLTDLVFRYTRFLPALPDPNYFTANTPWYLQTLPIPGALSAMAWYIVHEILVLRGNPEDAAGAQIALQYAEDEADKVFNDQARADQRTNNRRRPRGGERGSHRYRFGI